MSTSKISMDTQMKAIVYEKYGPPDVLQLKEVAKPTPRDAEVLVKVHAASVNYGDWALLRGKPFVVRLMSGGLLEPKNQILGADTAGRVEAVGGDVKQFRPGDEVFGDISASGFGGFAEYVSIPEDTLALKPANLAAMPDQEDLVFVKELLEAGKVVPVIDRRYPLNKVAEALRYYGEGHSQGKVVITVEQGQA
jgi:NADPH:quinone reductase-like Zn-dependent oxidoreductase